MTDLIRDGKILHWGISEAIEEYLCRAPCSLSRYCCAEPLFDDDSPIRKMFPLLEELDMGLVAFSPLANGLLTKCYTAETRFDVRMDYRAVMPQFQMNEF